MVEIRNSLVHGRGVFALCNIDKNIEICCDVITIPKNTQVLSDILRIYEYPWDKDYYSIMFGFGSFLNHSKNFNLKLHRIDIINKKVYFITIKSINIDEEIFIQYRHNTTFNT